MISCLMGKSLRNKGNRQKLPSAEEFEASLDEAQKWAASVGYDESDVDEMIKSAREKKRL